MGALLQGPKGHLCVAVSPLSGLLLTGSVDRHVRLWDGRSREGSSVKALFSSHSGWVSGLAWSPEKEHQFVSGSFDALVKLWDARSPKAPLYDLAAHEARVLGVDFGPGIVASGSADSTLRTFRVP